MTARNRLVEALAAITRGDRREALVNVHRAAAEDPGGPAYPDILEALTAADANDVETATLAVRAGIDAIDLAAREVAPAAVAAPGEVALIWREHGTGGRRLRIRNRTATAEPKWALEAREPGGWALVAGLPAEVAEEVRRLAAPARALRVEAAAAVLETARGAWDAAIARGEGVITAWEEAQAAVVARLREYSATGEANGAT